MKQFEIKAIIPFFLMAMVLLSCKKETKEPEPTRPTTQNSKIYPDTVWTTTGTGPHLIFRFKFDSTQARLDNLGNPSTIPAGNAGCSPKFNYMAAHSIELAPTDLTALGNGQVIYKAAETTKGGANAIDFAQSTIVREGVTFYSIPLSQVTPGTYKWLRLSLSYQNYHIPYKAALGSGTYIGQGTLASFLGFKTYVEKYKIKTQDFIPSSSVGGPGSPHPQGYWGFETNIPGFGYYTLDGQAPPGATTVVNPNSGNSPVPAGSCVVTALFADNNGATQQLTITGSETRDIIVTVSLSTNKSFEWTEVLADGYYQPGIGEAPVNMGIRGMNPKVLY